jgi:two-component system NtrC family sensor kinase
VNSWGPQSQVGQHRPAARFSAIHDPRPADRALRRVVSTGGKLSAGSERKVILLVEDDYSIREAVYDILEGEGYDVVQAENGREALERLRAGAPPDLIVLDLRMPVMDGWEFRAAQKNDPNLATIPVLAVSADGSAKAEAIAAEGYLRKPLSTSTLVEAVARILAQVERQRLLGRLEEAERFAALGRLAAGVGHEINNPLTYVSVNVDLAVTEIGSWLAGARAHAGAHTTHLGEGPASAAAATGSGPTPERLATLREMLEESRSGLRRIRDVVKNLQSLSRPPEPKRELFSLNEVLDESLAMARNHVDHRATVVKRYGVLPPLAGDRSAIGQVFLNLLLNAAQALPEGHAEDNEIVLTTSVAEGELAVEIRDTGAGIPRDVLPHIFEQFYTTKPIGEGTGLGLAVSHRIVTDHGGQIQVDSELGRGSTIRVVLPLRPLAERADRAQ